MEVEQAYREVQRVTRTRAKNFAYGIMVLPAPKRRAIAAVYAFAREVDDVADGSLPRYEKRERLESLRVALHEPPHSAMEVALADARKRFPISNGALEAIVDGGLQDTEQARYATYDELRAYCDKVAGAVGVACIAVYGSNDVVGAQRLGAGLQLINIMRDVAEDWQLGRVYLPQEDLTRFGVSEDDIADTRTGASWQELMTFEASRAEELVRSGLESLEPSLDRRSALCVSTFARLYLEQLEHMRRNSFDVYRGSCRLSTREKLAVVARGLVA
jgi:phytoene synthase